ncbi:MAG: DUF3306 domain-containing protein [Betaproteobacteria bacterium]|nr:MAG: DUF3306 domain-containing protein [Betaproteobacteria bacterium]
MTGKRKDEEGFSLRRWSRRKLEATRAAPAPAGQAAPTVTVPIAPSVPATPAPIELPPVESLTFDSDFTAFLRPEVDPDLKRAALKQLFRDPRFNVMDGLDTYIDDYTKADPIPSEMLAGLMQRFGRLPETTETPPVAPNERESVDAPPQPSLEQATRSEGEEAVAPSAAGGEDAPAERNAGEALIPADPRSENR